MNSVNRNKSIAEREYNATSSVSSEMMKTDASLIERELAASIKLIESGLTHLDTEAAHLLNPKINDISDIQYSPKSSKSLKTSKSSKVSKSSKSKDVFDDAVRNVYFKSKLDEAVRDEAKQLMRDGPQLLNPPDLKFSFYSSTEYIIPSAQFESVKALLESPNSPSVPTKSGLESETSDKREHHFSKSNLESEKRTSNPSNSKIKSDKSVIEMHDITESLLKIKSALDNLDREAEYLFNPVGSKLSYCKPSLETLPSLENNELYPLKEE